MPNSSWGLRIAVGLLLSGSVLNSGCSALVAYSGEDVCKLANREQVRERFGIPAKLGNEEGSHFEEYHTRRKISHDQVAGGCIVGGLSTLGLSELVLLPHVVGRTAWATLVGQTLRFEYAANGDVRNVYIDGAQGGVRFHVYTMPPPW